MIDASPERLAAAREQGSKNSKANRSKHAHSKGRAMSFSLRSSPYTEHHHRKSEPPPIPLGTRVTYTGTEYSVRKGAEAVIVNWGAAETVKGTRSKGGRAIARGSYVLEFQGGWKGLATADEFTVLA